MRRRLQSTAGLRPECVTQLGRSCGFPVRTKVQATRHVWMRAITLAVLSGLAGARAETADAKIVVQIVEAPKIQKEYREALGLSVVSIRLKTKMSVGRPDLVVPLADGAALVHAGLQSAGSDRSETIYSASIVWGDPKELDACTVQLSSQSPIEKNISAAVPAERFLERSGSAKQRLKLTYSNLCGDREGKIVSTQYTVGPFDVVFARGAPR